MPANKLQILKLKGKDADTDAYDEAAAILRAGGIVAFPTETVYGLGADAGNQSALERLNQIKGRPAGKPYSLHVYSEKQIRDLGCHPGVLAKQLMKKFWPGPLTLVLPSDEGGTLGIRFPGHPIALAFLRACQVPVAAPSANRSGAAPARCAQDVINALNGEIDCLLDGGPSNLGCSSTVVAVREEGIHILREGAISAEKIHSAIG